MHVSVLPLAGNVPFHKEALQQLFLLPIDSSEPLHRVLEFADTNFLTIGDHDVPAQVEPRFRTLKQGSHPGLLHHREERRTTPNNAEQRATACVAYGERSGTVRQALVWWLTERR